MCEILDQLIEHIRDPLVPVEKQVELYKDSYLAIIGLVDSLAEEEYNETLDILELMEQNIKISEEQLLFLRKTLLAKTCD